MKLMEHVYQVGGPSLSHPFDATAYLLPCEDGSLVMIDCGSPEGAPQIEDNIKRLGFDPRRVSRIYATHGHYDHVGGAAHFDVPLLIHPLDAKQVETGDSIRTSASILYGKTMPTLKVAGHINEGDVFQVLAGEIQTIHCPGHSPGSCCFLLTHTNTQRLLFAGDALHGGFSSLVGSDEAAWKKTLDKLRDMHIDCYTFGHCPPALMCDANRRIQSLRQSFANYYTPWFKDFYRDYPY